MKIFDDMTFSGTPDALAKFIERLDQSPQIGPWTRDRESEQSHAMIRPAPETDHCFRTLTDTGLPDAFLWMFPQGKMTAWRVTNIVPVESNRSFSEETYYSLLISFRDATLPLAMEAGVSISTPSLHVGPEYWLTEKQVHLLDHFSQNANKSTGSAHPQDRKRWHDFIIAVHRDGSDVSGADIGRILFEHYHWSERMANELAIEFDQQLDLLRDFAKSA
jgi:hypothetical protein